MKTETILQIAIVEFLSLNCNAHEFLFFSVPNEGAFMNGRNNDFRIMQTLKKMGLTPGVPDLVILKDCKFYALEVKSKTGRQSVVQKLVEKRIKECGGRYEVTKSLNQTIRILKEWRIIK